MKPSITRVAFSIDYLFSRIFIPTAEIYDGGGEELRESQVSQVFNISLLQFIKRHTGVSVSDILDSEEFKGSSSAVVEGELTVLVGMGEIRLTEDKKYV